MVLPRKRHITTAVLRSMLADPVLRGEFPFLAVPPMRPATCKCKQGQKVLDENTLKAEIAGMADTRKAVLAQLLKADEFELRWVDGAAGPKRLVWKA